MDKALLVIDYTNDFVADNGALTCGKPAQIIDQRIYELIQDFVKNGQRIIVCNDYHRKEDFEQPFPSREGKLFPPHNIVGTLGREVYGKTGEILKSSLHSSYSKVLYDAMISKVQEDLYTHDINEVHLVGVCTDICILHTAIGLYNRLAYKIVIHEDAVASFNQQGHEWAINHFKNVLGAQVVKEYKL